MVEDKAKQPEQVKAKKPTYRPKIVKEHRLPTAILGLDISPNGKVGVAGCMDGTYLVQLENGKFDKIADHESYVSSVVMIEGKQLVIAADYHGDVSWIDLVQKKVVRRVHAHDFWCWRMGVSGDGKTIATVSGQYIAGDIKYTPAKAKDASVKLFDVDSGELKHGFEMTPSVQAVGMSGDGKYVGAGNLMGEVKVWEIGSGKLVGEFKTDVLTSWGIIKSHCYLGGVFDLVFSPDSKHVYIAGMGFMRDPMAGNGKQIWMMYDWRQGKLVQEANKGETGEGLMEALAFHPSGEVFAMGGRLVKGEWNLALFEAGSGKRVHHVKAPPRTTAIRFSGDGKQMFASGCDTQPNPNGKSPKHFGRLQIFDLEV